MSQSTFVRQSLEGVTDGYDRMVRSFDAPEALDTRSYEVRARSALNRVPGRSRMPYCLGGDTRILKADGRTVPIADLQVGEPIYGTVKEGAWRRFQITRVLAKWLSIKPAYVVTLEDGAEIVASAEHRFLTRLGWKHVVGAEHGLLRRPHLTRNNKLLGPGGFVDPPQVDDDYRRGYLCGMIRGDGHLGRYSFIATSGAQLNRHRFRLALTDDQALDRSREYLEHFGVLTTRYAFATASGNRRAMTAIHTQRAMNIDRIEELTAWPPLPTRTWIKGFLAGIFDAEGTGHHCLRIANTDTEIIDWICVCLAELDFGFGMHRGNDPNPATIVRVRGGLPERIRFFLTTDPAITRKRSIAGDALKTQAKLRVTSIRSLGIVMRMYDITTGTGDFIANGVVSHNCFTVLPQIPRLRRWPVGLCVQPYQSANADALRRPSSGSRCSGRHTG